MEVLVAGSPCALAISTPSAILSAIARAAKERVLIKGGKALEIMGGLDAIAFDKTGTLTKGKPIVKSILNYNISIEELHEVLYVMELSSTHPLAKAVTKACEEFINKDAIEPLDNVQNISGRGMVANYRNDKILVGNRELIDENNIAISKEIQDKILLLHDSGHTTILIAKNTEVVGLVSLIDEPRETSKQVIAELKKLGITRLAMLTGDNNKVAQSIGKDLGLTEIYGSLLPEDKLTIIDKLVSEYSEVAMIGDGTNDAPAMAHSSVGIAMGAAGSDVALETADVALLSDKIENLPFVIGLGRKSKQIIKQNLFISLGTILFLIPASIVGLTNMGLTVFIHEGSTVLVVFNALRLLKYKNKINIENQKFKEI
jgi:Cd2+/Zn2+-exporting ATPase